MTNPDNQWLLVDLTHSIDDSLPVFEGDEPVSLTNVKEIAKDGFTDYVLHSGMHVGTHIDGALHMNRNGGFISDYPLDVFIGQGFFIDLTLGDYQTAFAKIENVDLSGRVVVLCFGYSSHWRTPDYFTSYPSIDEEFISILVRKGVKMIGMDTPSPDYFPYPVHLLLFEHNVLIIENLTNLVMLKDADYFEIIALPLKVNSDSAPARVIARLKA